MPRLIPDGWLDDDGHAGRNELIERISRDVVGPAMTRQARVVLVGIDLLAREQAPGHGRGDLKVVRSR